MSDPLSSREIEDVLSSIRRLVSQEGTRGDRGADHDPRAASRLVLTEAQRIAGPEVPHVSPPTDDLPALEAALAEVEAAVTATDARLDSAAGDVADPSAEPLESDAPIVAPPSNVTALYGRLSFIHREMTEAPVPPRPASDMAETPGTTEGVDPQTQVESPVQAAVPMDAAPQDAAPQDALPQDAAPEPVPPRAPAPVAERPSGHDAPAAAPVSLLDNNLDETVIDEEMLRALVAQLVRDELRGQLGEKITHQVRKLVRAEIARVLDERNLI